MGKQEEVSIFMSQYDMDIKPEFRALDIAAEFGEVASEMLSNSSYGEQAVTKTSELEAEIGDLYFSLIALANRLNIDLDMALEDALEKYRERIEQDETASSGEKQERQQEQQQREPDTPTQDSTTPQGPTEGDNEYQFADKVGETPDEEIDLGEEI